MRHSVSRIDSSNDIYEVRLILVTENRPKISL